MLTDRSQKSIKLKDSLHLESLPELSTLSRRQFLQTSAVGLGGLALSTWLPRRSSLSALTLPEFPQAERLGRVFEDKVPVYLRPDDQSQVVKVLYQDDIVVWLKEGVGSRKLWHHQRFVETPLGYIYAPNLQPVANRPNTAIASLPEAGGMWVETTVPYVDITLANPPARSPWLKYTPKPRLYYSQIMWVDQIKRDEQGRILYRVSDRYGSYGDFFWAAGEAFRPLTAEELSPIHPEVEEKLVVVDLTYQSMSCFEGQNELYYCRVSTGVRLDSKQHPQEDWATPPGKHTIWRKLISVHMTGGTTGGGYDLPGIGWTTLFASKGMAIHSTFWHNSFGVPRSHGCVNASPEDAQWVFRWTQPAVPLEPGDVQISGQGSTRVLVLEA